MAFVIRRAGSKFQETLEGTGVIVTCIAPDAHIADECIRAINAVGKKGPGLVQALRTVFGHLFDAVDGLELEGGEKFALEKDSIGALTGECMSMLIPLLGKLQSLAMRILGFGSDEDAERKNS